MVQISKSELAKLKESFPKIDSFTTMKKKSSRGKIYISEYNDVMLKLMELRTNGVVHN